MAISIGVLLGYMGCVSINKSFSFFKHFIIKGVAIPQYIPCHPQNAIGTIKVKISEEK